jgi:type IV pilus assembly protein PilP
MMHRVVSLLAVALVAGCSSRDADLDRFIEHTKQEQPGGVAPLPEVKPYDSFVYDAAGMRSPFMPGTSSEASTSNVRPTSQRNREYLEQFALDALSMGGTITIKGRTYGLVKTKSNQVLQVLPGNYLGQNEGRVTKVEPSRISITEIVPDGLGGYMERVSALTLND